MTALYAAPGNPGIARHAKCVPIAANALDDIVRFAEGERIDLTVIGPEVPLVAGLADRLAAARRTVFGPSALLFGMVSPFAVRLSSTDLRKMGNISGSLFALSTFDTDYVLVREEDLTRAVEALQGAGCIIASGAIAVDRGKPLLPRRR